MSEQPILSEAAHLDAEMLKPLPRSQKVHVTGNDDVRVGMREIALSPTSVQPPGGAGSPQLTPNPHLRVYDTSGPYTDPDIDVDVRAGIPRLRDAWILARGDTEPLPGFSSSYTLSRNADEALQKLRFAHLRTPRRALPGRNVTQMHYARAGIVTPEMEYIAIRENLARANPGYNPGQHPGENFGASTPGEITAEFVRAEV
ncbi:MAG: phosphomethylpyrimidine synthase ThiC, partial [Gammaproteobacteria bacterium]|nr:phosphomethylpyrimidine synthase ThiC [Gammaproteobacteria bacterium]